MKTLNKIVPFTNVLGYKNEAVVERFEEKLKLNKRQARQLFRDVLVFLYICTVTRTDRSIAPPTKIDDGWHEFLMFTRDYMEFCHQYFGAYIHHVPTRKADRLSGRKVKRFDTRAEAVKLLHAVGDEPSENWGLALAICDGGNGNDPCYRVKATICDGSFGNDPCYPAVTSAECEPRGGGVCMASRKKEAEENQTADCIRCLLGRCEVENKTEQSVVHSHQG